jgi:hypothetical protein
MTSTLDQLSLDEVLALPRCPSPARARRQLEAATCLHRRVPKVVIPRHSPEQRALRGMKKRDFSLRMLPGRLSGARQATPPELHQSLVHRSQALDGPGDG